MGLERVGIGDLQGGDNRFNRRQKVDTHLLLPRRDSEAEQVPHFAKNSSSLEREFFIQAKGLVCNLWFDYIQYFVLISYGLNIRLHTTASR